MNTESNHSHLLGKFQNYVSDIEGIINKIRFNKIKDDHYQIIKLYENMTGFYADHVELDPETGHLVDEANGHWTADNPVYHNVAKGPPTDEFPDGGAIEAAFVYQHEEYFYLFVNWGVCCSGVKSTVTILFVFN